MSTPPIKQVKSPRQETQLIHKRPNEFEFEYEYKFYLSHSFFSIVENKYLFKIEFRKFRSKNE